MTVKISHLDPMVANLAIYKLMKSFALRSRIDSFENSLLSVARISSFVVCRGLRLS